MPDSSLRAIRLRTVSLYLIAAPGYCARHGTPHTPADLAQHQVVHYRSPSSGRAAPWEWLEGDALRTLDVRGAVGVNNVESYIACALAGLGLIQIPRYDVLQHLQAGELVQVLPAHCAPPMPVHMLYPHRTHLSRRVRVFIDWMEPLLAQAGVLPSAIKN